MENEHCVILPMQSGPMRVLLVIVTAAMILCTMPVGLYAETTKITHTNNIMLTGFWNPTGQMMQHYSTNKWLNPGGWLGGNWNGTGYDVHAFFPTPGTYNGTFEVDYQKTRSDFENITNTLKPIAIISFGWGTGPWEIEYNARNLGTWVPDTVPPTQPTPNPPDGTVTVNYVRHSTLPVDEIADAVNSSTKIKAWVDYPGDPGMYLCEFIAYLGMWYREEHGYPDDPDYCAAAGFIHVAGGLDLAECMKALNVTLQTVIDSIKTKITECGPALMIFTIIAIAVTATAVYVCRRRNIFR